MTSSFRALVREAIRNENLQVALDRNADKKVLTRSEVLAALPDAPQLRELGKQIRQKTVANLELHLDQFTRAIEKNGFILHPASTAEMARQILLDIVRSQDANLVVKSKSMVSEEIHINQELENHDIEVVETDLGEFIVQLRGEPPSHIVAPAIHLRREDVGKTFQDKLGMPYTEDVEVMNRTARDTLRQKFLSADVGISGVNFGVAETGTLCIVTNEGNGRMVTSLPKTHIALMGIERLVPTMDDLEIMLRLLPRFATGQKLTSYVSLIQGPRSPSEPDGPTERHLILIDNGRRKLRQSALSEALLCIRCGSCLDHCPVYREIGGYPYESVYTGPIGSVISPGLFSMETYGHLAKASTLCGACKDACPVDIDLPTLLLRVRGKYIQNAFQPRIPRFGIRAFTWIMEHTSRLRLAQDLAAWGTRLLPKIDGWVAWLPSPLSGWTKSRTFPPFQATSFRHSFKSIHQTTASHPDGKDLRSDRRQAPSELKELDLIERFSKELIELGGEIIHCEIDQLSQNLLPILHEVGQGKVIAWDFEEGYGGNVKHELIEEGIEFVDPSLSTLNPVEREVKIQTLGEVTVGVTGATAGFADTGTLVLASGPGRSNLASLLPPTHIAILPVEKMHRSMSEWLETQGRDLIRNSQIVTLVSGPSRTADIEMTLSIGVHGPGRLIVFCVE